MRMKEGPKCEVMGWKKKALRHDVDDVGFRAGYVSPIIAVWLSPM